MPKIIKIGFASTDWSRSMTDDSGAPVPGGANWVRLQQNRRNLKYKSVTGLLLHHPQKGFGIADWYQNAHYDCDVIILQRLMFGNLIDVLEKRNSSQIIINDIDDWYWGLHEDNAAYKLTHPDYNKTENIDFYKTIIQMCDGVTVSTPFLADKVQNEFGCQRVDIIENCVSINDFRKRYHRQRKMKIGWVGSTSHRSGDLEILQGTIDHRKYLTHHSGHLNGAPFFADKIGIPRHRVTLGPMHHPLNYARLSFEFDCGLAPLNDVPFNHAKSWIKGIEYAASNVPFIASDVGEYRRLYDVYGIGRLASCTEDWIRHFDELQDASLRAEEAKQQSERVQALDVKIMADNWSKLIDSYL